MTRSGTWRCSHNHGRGWWRVALPMLAAVIVAGWPGSVAWALGLLVGIISPAARLNTIQQIGADRGINRKARFVH
jgi:hypothetical protein